MLNTWPRTAQRLEGDLNSLNVILYDGQMNRLNEVSSVSPGSPHGVIAESQASISGAGSGAVETKYVVA